MSLIDDFIGVFSPSAKLSRVRARRAIEIISKRSYDGANSGRRTSGWITPSTSANSEITPSISKLRDRSRDLVRNNPYAAKALRVLVSNTVGTGIVPSIKDRKTLKLYAKWIRECDADGQLNYYGIQRLIARTVFESGECLIRFRYRRPEDNLSVPLQLQVLEPDYIDNNKNELLKTGGYIQNGIEYDPIGRRVAYWLYKQHPGENNGIAWQSLQSSRVLAEDIIHVYEKLRPGQSRGVPVLAPIMMTANDLDEYEEATLVRKAAEACITAIVESDDESRRLGGETIESGTQNHLEELAPGMIEYLSSGEKIIFNNPPASNGYSEYINTRLHAIAAGTGVTYEQMTGDLSQVNYSSIRAGTLDFRKEIEQFQWLTFIPVVCDRIMSVWLKTANLIEKSIKIDQVIEHTTPKWDWVDPLKDIKGEEMEIGNNLKSWSEGARQRGYNPADLMAEIVADRKMFEAAGIPYPSNQSAPMQQDINSQN